jgi:hypothetical protein
MTSEILFDLLSIRCCSGFIEKIQSIAIDNIAFTSAQMAIEKKNIMRRLLPSSSFKKGFATATILDPIGLRRINISEADKIVFH